MVCMGKWVPQCRLLCCIPLRFGANEGHDYVSVGLVSEFSGWEDITGRQQRCQSLTLSPLVTTSLIEQLFQNGQKKSERPGVQRLNLAVQGPFWGWHTSLTLHKSCPLCQEPRDSWILLKMLCKWGVIVSPLQLLLYSKANSSSGYLRTHGWKVLGLPTPIHSLVTSLCWPGSRCQLAQERGKWAHLPELQDGPAGRHCWGQGERPLG